jgi:hypothetical protein
VVESQCSPKYVYDESGILIGTAVHNIQVFEKKGDKKGMKVLKPNKYGTKFIPWKGISYIQMEGLLVEEPNYISTNIFYNISEVALDAWDNRLKASVENITRLRNSLERLVISDPPKQTMSPLIIIILGAGIILFVAAGIIALYYFARYKFAAKYLQAADHEQSNEQSEDPQYSERQSTTPNNANSVIIH